MGVGCHIYLAAVLRRPVSKRWSPRTDATAHGRELPSAAIEPPLSMTRRRTTEQSRWAWNCVAQPPLLTTPRFLNLLVLRTLGIHPHPRIRSVRANFMEVSSRISSNCYNLSSFTALVVSLHCISCDDLMHSCLHSFIHLFIHSFIHSFIVVFLFHQLRCCNFSA